MIYPDFKKFREWCSSSKMVPVCLEMEGDTETPITLFQKLCKSKNSYLLESVEGGEKWGRYSYIGRNPFMTIRSQGNKVVVNKGNEVIIRTGKALKIIKEIMGDFKTPQIGFLPDFTGGAVGYVGYDVIRDYENLPNVNPDDLKMPDVHLLMTREVIVFDHVRQKVIIIVNVPVSGDPEKMYRDGIDRLDAVRKELLENTPVSGEDRDFPGKMVREYSSNESKQEFMQKVLRAKEYIRNGDIFQVVLSQRLKIRTRVRPFKAYRILRSLNPSPYLFYLDFGDYCLVGSSPELLVKVEGDVVETCPIAGTRPRGRTAEEDMRYAQELLNDEKELAEHLMLVDLARNDIGKIARFGTVEVNRFQYIQKYSHVMHIVSNVRGRMREDCDMFDALEACLPAGTVSGAPKVRAMEIIDELENRKRGVYAGAVGYLGFNGNMDTCIAIRTIIFKDRSAYIQAGAGIVADSDSEREYEETLRKARALMVTINKAEGMYHDCDNRQL